MIMAPEHSQPMDESQGEMLPPPTGTHATQESLEFMEVDPPPPSPDQGMADAAPDSSPPAADKAPPTVQDASPSQGARDDKQQSPIVVDLSDEPDEVEASGVEESEPMDEGGQGQPPACADGGGAMHSPASPNPPAVAARSVGFRGGGRSLLSSMEAVASPTGIEGGGGGSQGSQHGSPVMRSPAGAQASCEVRDASSSGMAMGDEESASDEGLIQLKGQGQTESPPAAMGVQSDDGDNGDVEWLGTSAGAPEDRTGSAARHGLTRSDGEEEGEVSQPGRASAGPPEAYGGPFRGSLGPPGSQSGSRSEEGRGRGGGGSQRSQSVPWVPRGKRPAATPPAELQQPKIMEAFQRQLKRKASSIEGAGQSTGGAASSQSVPRRPGEPQGSQPSRKRHSRTPEPQIDESEFLSSSASAPSSGATQRSSQPQSSTWPVSSPSSPMDRRPGSGLSPASATALPPQGASPPEGMVGSGHDDRSRDVDHDSWARDDSLAVSSSAAGARDGPPWDQSTEPTEVACEMEVVEERGSPVGGDGGSEMPGIDDDGTGAGWREHETGAESRMPSQSSHLSEELVVIAEAVDPGAAPSQDDPLVPAPALEPDAGPMMEVLPAEADHFEGGSETREAVGGCTPEPASSLCGDAEPLPPASAVEMETMDIPPTPDVSRPPRPGGGVIRDTQERGGMGIDSLGASQSPSLLRSGAPPEGVLTSTATPCHPPATPPRASCAEDQPSEDLLGAASPTESLSPALHDAVHDNGSPSPSASRQAPASEAHPPDQDSARYGACHDERTDDSVRLLEGQDGERGNGANETPPLRSARRHGPVKVVPDTQALRTKSGEEDTLDESLESAAAACCPAVAPASSPGVRLAVLDTQDAGGKGRLNSLPTDETWGAADEEAAKQDKPRALSLGSPNQPAPALDDGAGALLSPANGPMTPPLPPRAQDGGDQDDHVSPPIASPGDFGGLPSTQVSRPVQRFPFSPCCGPLVRCKECFRFNRMCCLWPRGLEPQLDNSAA
jgi:hypothetical protein